MESAKTPYFLAYVRQDKIDAISSPICRQFPGRILLGLHLRPPQKCLAEIQRRCRDGGCRREGNFHLEGVSKDSLLSCLHQARQTWRHGVTNLSADQSQLHTFLPTWGKTNLTRFPHQSVGNSQGGHYWVYIHDHARNVWRKYNDDVVTEVAEKEIFNQRESSKTPYFLAYVRNDKIDAMASPICREIAG